MGGRLDMAVLRKTGKTRDSAFPDWVPHDVRHYLIHTEDGTSIRELARDVGCHASTILRQVRRNETRRDDPLIDDALRRLAVAHRHSTTLQEDDDVMTRPMPRAAKPLPKEDRINTEARRVLRRLCEPQACLAVSSGMEKAVVVRESEDGRTIRTAVLDREIAEAFVLKDWIAGEARGRISRYWITTAGRAALKRLLSEEQAARGNGFEDAQTPFGDQHRVWDERDVGGAGGAPKKRIRYNVAESPISALARRKGRDGKPFLSDDLVAAGERLREDFELGQMGPRVAQNWDRFLTGGDRGAFNTSQGTGPEAARDRVAAALRELGPGLGDVVLRCCCFLEGMEQAEKRMGWAARSGKIVLKIALQRLKRHYDETGGPGSMIG